MPRLAPVTRSELIRTLREFGFEGPFAGGRHSFMIREGLRLTLPNPHRRDIRVDLLSRILNQAGISRDEWVSAK